MMSPVSIHAHQGLERGFADAAKASEAFVSSFAASEAGAASRTPGLRSDQTVRAATDLLRAKASVKANAKVMRTGDQMMGALLDILA